MGSKYIECLKSGRWEAPPPKCVSEYFIEIKSVIAILQVFTIVCMSNKDDKYFTAV